MVGLIRVCCGARPRREYAKYHGYGFSLSLVGNRVLGGRSGKMAKHYALGTHATDERWDIVCHVDLDAWCVGSPMCGKWAAMEGPHCMQLRGSFFARCRSFARYGSLPRSAPSLPADAHAQSPCAQPALPAALRERCMSAANSGLS